MGCDRGKDRRRVWKREAGPASRYTPLWERVKQDDRSEFKLIFAEIHGVTGFAIDHSFLNLEKGLKDHDCEVGKISLENQTVALRRTES